MYFKPQAVRLLVCLVGIGVLLPGDVSRLSSKTLASAAPDLLLTQINHIAANITVKVWGTDALGSGIIINRQGSVYTVVTNQHVLRAGTTPYQIQTSDGKIYPAKVLKTSSSTQYDLALLSFRSNNKDYQTAIMGNSSALAVGEPILAGGFPAEIEEISLPTTRLKTLAGFSLKRGRIAVILDQALEEGYQIGYTNDVEKGMSGGPLMNSRGEVVGINGKHAYPLWDAPDFFEDGSQPCPPLQELIIRSSLAIPVERITEITTDLNLASQSSSVLNDTDVSPIIVDSDKNGNTAQLISKMQAEAEANKNCRKLPGETNPLEARQ